MRALLAILAVIITAATVATVAAAENTEPPPLPQEVVEIIQQKGVLLGIHRERRLGKVGIPAAVLYWAAGKAYSLTVLLKKNGGKYIFPEKANSQTVISVVWVENGLKKEWINIPLLKKIISDLLLAPPSGGLEKEDIKYDI